MRDFSMLLLRVTLGGLTVFWGLDKLVNVEHSVAVADAFYLGIGASVVFLQAFGVAQTGLGVLIVDGLYRRYVYPPLVLISLVTAMGVWRSIVDPWGWALEGTNVLFYPSIIILAAALVLLGFQDEDAWSLDAPSAES